MAQFVRANSNNLPHVDFFMVHEFLKKDDRFNLAEVKGSKASHSMRDSYGDNAVGYVEVRRENNICFLKGRVCPEHNVKKPNYIVELIVDEDKEIVEDVICNSCPAAAGGCKHALAFLMWTKRRSEEPSPTEVASYWQKPVLAKIGSSLKFMEVKDFASGKIKKTGSENEAKSNVFFENLMNEAKRQKIDCQLSRIQTIPLEYDMLSIHKLMFKFKREGLTEFEDFLNFSANHCLSKYINAEEDTRSQSKSPLWFELRYGRVTASKLYEVSRCKTSDGTLVSSVIGAHKIKPTKQMERGNKLEAMVLKAAEEKLLTKFKKCGFFILPNISIFGASPDGITDDFVVEVKCPSTAKTLKNYLKDDEIKNKYKAQIHLQMMATNKRKGLFVIAEPDFETTGNLIMKWVDYEKEFIDDVINNSMLFYKSNIFNKLYSVA